MTDPTDPHARLAALPRIDDLVAGAGDLVARYGRAPTTAALREAVEDARRAVLAGEVDADAHPDALRAAAAVALAAQRPGPPVRVLNATGVVVHTNLGRAPLADAARAAVAEAAGACDLEYDLATGGRGSRGARVEPLLVAATGAEAGIAVNNAAAALVLALAAVAGGRGVLVSRGELVEIGGSFRLPEIMAASGARLVEVGTTNRTRARDYAAPAGGDEVGAVLAVHPSNYRITGFTEAPPLPDLAAVARERGLPLLHDVGSGLLADRDEPWLAGEPSLRGSLAAGADLVLASGDKLLGGPQAGLLVGRADLVDRCRRHPLARALRLDKLRIAALVATLELHLADREPEVPVWGMLGADRAALTARAETLAAAVGGRVEDGESVVGGGAAPGAAVPGPVVRVTTSAPDRVAERLRAGTPPVVVRVGDGVVLVDVRTVPSDADPVLAARVASALAATRE